MAELLLACPVCGHPARKHDGSGCTMGGRHDGCWCSETPEDINPPAAAAEPVAFELPPPTEVGPVVVDVRDAAPTVTLVADVDEVSCVRCGDLVLTLSSRFRCDGCEAEADLRPALAANPAEVAERIRQAIVDVEVLERLPSWLCEACKSSAVGGGTCCGRSRVAIWVTLTRREVA